MKKKRGLDYWIPAILMAAMTIVVTIEVVTRFLGNPIIWGEEVAIWIMIWIIFVGLSYSFKDGGLISVDFFASKMKPKTQKILNINAMVLTAIYFAIILASAIPYFMYLRSKESIYPMTGFPTNISTVAVILGCVLAIAFAIKNLVHYVKTPAEQQTVIPPSSDEEVGGEDK